MFRLDNGSPCCELFEIELTHNHCCLALVECAHDPQVPLICTQEQEKYYLFLKSKNTKKKINYCPWCAWLLTRKPTKPNSPSEPATKPTNIYLSDFCCEILKESIQDDQFPIDYDAQWREYSLNSCYLISYCPWCAYAFPQELRNKWFDILEHEYDIDDPFGDKRRIPKIFRDDTWWKKRGL